MPAFRARSKRTRLNELARKYDQSLHVPAGLFGGSSSAFATLVTSTATAATNTARRTGSPALAAATLVRCRAMHDRQPREKSFSDVEENP